MDQHGHRRHRPQTARESERIERLYSWRIDSEHFSESVRKHGDACCAEGRVQLERVIDGFVVAFVRGSRRYRIRLEHRDGEIFDFYCNCLAFEQVQSCKHVWATFRALDRGGDRIESASGSTEATSTPSLWRDPSTLVHARIRSIISEDRSSTDWKTYLDRLQRLVNIDRPPRWPRTETGEIELFFWLAGSRADRSICDPVIQVIERRRLQNGWGEPRPLDLRTRPLAEVTGGEVLRLLEMLEPFLSAPSENWSYRPQTAPPIRLPGAAGVGVVRALAESGLLFPADGVPESSQPLRFDPAPWSFSFGLVPIGDDIQESAEVEENEALQYTVSAGFDRENSYIPIDTPSFITSSGLLYADGVITPFIPVDDIRWVRALVMFPPIIPAQEVPAFVRTILEEHPAAPLRTPAGFEVEIEPGTPQPRLVIRPHSGSGKSGKGLTCKLSFLYGTTSLSGEADHKSETFVEVDPDAPGSTIRLQQRVIARDLDTERRCVAELLTSGARRAVQDETLEQVTVGQTRLGDLIERLLFRGWRVEAEGRLHRVASEFNVKVKSNIDWLDLSGNVNFGDETVEFPRLLGAIRRGQRLITLSDGSFGVLPEEWMRRSGLLAQFGELDGGIVRFRPNQAWVIDALLEDVPDIQIDEQFSKLRSRLRNFDGIEAKHERPSIQGELRPYQRDGLGWLDFLRDFQLGGCLADDMGLGKTLQVIAHLEDLRCRKELKLPVLVVAPRSVVEHWARETATFAPELKVLDLSGPDRQELRKELKNTHIALITYAILRIDITDLLETTFDTIILDEAQAIKNARSQTAKAARLIRANHRLALSGTPIENHIGELWSLFEFLQPGMLGKASRFGTLTAGGEDSPATPDRRRSHMGLDLLARAVRPFILRRTKGQVATDLPERTELTLTCELEPHQQELYEELAQHYRRSLLPETQSGEFGSMKMKIIEALLRLRQAACHPGLLDPSRLSESSGKLTTIIERIRELQEEGHRCLVFSQFTKFLAIVRSRLDECGVRYEYLDGATRNRQERVDRFQAEDGITAFLISLKAGGLGLNLTAADYVFILDPWWNPATEAQAIDRAHRIGQTRQVFAYRLISPGTVEEKITRLQEKKRTLADAIIRADEGLVKSLTAEDLEFILS